MAGEKKEKVGEWTADVKRDPKNLPTGKGVDVSKEDEILPDRAEQVPPPSTGGEEPDTAGQHGRMAPEAAEGLERARKKT